MQQDQDFSNQMSNIGIGGYQPQGMEMFNSFPKPLGGPMDGYRGPMAQPNGIMAALPNYNQPLQQYGQYLEQQYGKPDFPQKRDLFLQEVSQKEQQTFRNNMANSVYQPMLGQPIGMTSGQLPNSYGFPGLMGFGNSILQSAVQPQPISEPMQNYNNMSPFNYNMSLRGNPPGSAR